MADVPVPAWVAILTPLISAVGGWALKSVTDAMDYRRNRQRDKDARDHQRRQMLFERRITFQRETLLKLQEAAHELARATGAMYYQDVMAHRGSGEWRKNQYSSDLGERYAAAQSQTLMLSERVRDEAVRAAVRELREYSN